MREFKIGDKVRINRTVDPDDYIGGPSWNSDMEKDIGKIGEIQDISNMGRYVHVRVKGSRRSWAWFSKDLTPVSKIKLSTNKITIEVDQRRGGILIKTKKYVGTNGVTYREVLKLKALPYHKLPELYTKHKTSFWKKGNSFYKQTIGGLYAFLAEGESYSANKFQEHLEFIKECGTRLMNCKKAIEILKETWNGEETFII